MKNSSSASDKIGNAKSVLNRHEQHFKRGTLMFIEGESSYEMFIIRSGKVRILKQEGECTIELAVLGPGSVIGELSLLDRQPRSATAQVVEDTVVTVIDEELFARTISNVPSWLSGMIQLVVKRLRDTMKKTSDDIITRSISGFIKIMLLLDINEGILIGDTRGVSLSKLKETVFSITGLGGLDVERLLLHLILKDMVLIHRTQSIKEYVILKSPEVLQLYMNFLRARQCGSFLIGEDFSDNAFDLISMMLTAGERNGCKEANALVRVSQQQVEIELERAGKGKFINRDAFEVLENARLLIKQDDVTETEHGKHKRTVFIFNSDTLKRVVLLKSWLSVFKEEISF
ncbi:MAG TPA: cyclic nucleotide-binding domain-containing protein [Chitinispirillaceae bacterium]|nr:cyclic nucleotide-binding domain-containing protein [Chitinispirillaceae bacterium]